MTMAFISKRFRHVAKNLLAIVFTLAVYLIFVNRASALTDFPIGYSSRGGPSRFRQSDGAGALFSKVLEAIGIQPQKDVFLLQIGGQGARFAALKSGQVQSMIVDPPLTLVARKAGFRELLKLSHSRSLRQPHPL
jgi:ABC-type nitrate/sulfonate/bicarbonate transport system substrate-binding protein